MKKIIILVTMLFAMLLQSVALAAGQVKVMQIIRAPWPGQRPKGCSLL